MVDREGVICSVRCGQVLGQKVPCGMLNSNRVMGKCSIECGGLSILSGT